MSGYCYSATEYQVLNMKHSSVITLQAQMFLKLLLAHAVCKVVVMCQKLRIITNSDICLPM